MNTLRLASFGLRGVVGESLTPNAALRFVAAFGTFVRGKKVLLGCDTRSSSPMLKEIAKSALLATGCEIIDVGICPTPLIQFLVMDHAAEGAVSISGGHNGMGWNSISLIDAQGAYVDPVGGEAVLDAFHGRNLEYVPADSIGTVETLSNVHSHYFNTLAHYLDLENIRSEKFKVIVDPIAGAGCAYLEPFAETFGLDLLPINGEPSGYLPREPEPRPRSAIQMAAIIEAVNAQAGFLLSSDMSRCSLVTEDGEPISEECTFGLIANHVLQKNPGPVITNTCTSKIIDDLAVNYKVPLLKTKVGPAHILAKAIDEHAVLAGEGSGSVACPPFSPAFDGFLMIGLILEAMATQQKPLSTLKAELPIYHINKQFFPCPSSQVYRVLENLARYFKRCYRGELSQVDGIRMDFETGWIHVRASRTQQVIRIISEDLDEVQSQSRADDLVRFMLQEH